MINDSAKGHTTHVEDFLFDGKIGIPKIMVSIIDLMKGIPTTVSQSKIDGSLSCFYGFDEKGFFVASKSLFNKDPKINYTDADIERNHGHAPGLVSTLKECLRYLRNTVKVKGVVLQCDVMFTVKKPEIKKLNGKNYFVWQPNVVVNAVEVDSDLGKQIAKSKIGIAPHTAYVNGTKTGNFQQYIKPSTDVFFMPVEAPILSDYRNLQNQVDEMRKTINSVSRTGLDVISSSDVKPKALSFINYCVKNKLGVNYDNFISYCTELFDKQIEKVKTSSSKEKYAKEQKELIDLISSNKEGLQSVFNTHQEIARVKNNLIAELDKAQPILRFYKNELGELQKAEVEGYVTINKYGTAKMVNRDIFSFRNFMQNKSGVVREEYGIDSDLLIITEETKKDLAVVVPLGRFNPPHIEHLNLIHATQLAAKKYGGTPIIFVSVATDSKKNPLTASERIKILTKMTGKNIFEPSTNMFESLKRVNKKFKNVILILGDDRVSEIQRLKAYNGKDYHFDSMEVKSRQDFVNTRTSVGDGVHASDLRKWAKEGDFDSFRMAVPRSISDNEIKEIMTKIATRLK